MLRRDGPPLPHDSLLLLSLWILIAGVLFLPGCGGDDGDDNPVVETDVTPPAPIADLAVAGRSASSVTLSWTAPGDDGSEGTADSYDIRHAPASITDATWGTATQVTGEPSPRAAGSAESFTVRGLADSTIYHFAMKSADSEGNESLLSNSVACTTEAVPPVELQLAGYWMLFLVSDTEPDPQDRGDCLELIQNERTLTLLSLCFDGSVSGEILGDSVHFEVDDEEITLDGTATSSSMTGTWIGVDEGETDTGTWTALRMDRAPDARDCVEANTDVICGQTDAGWYVIAAQLDDHARIVQSAHLSGDLLDGEFPLSDTLFPEEEEEWWTDPLEPDLTVSVGQPPAFPLEYDVRITFMDGTTRTLTRIVTRSYEVDLPNCRWQTVFTDAFDSTTLDDRWILYEGEDDLYILDGEDIAVDDSDLYTDGPLFVHERAGEGDRVRISCLVRTEEMNGDVEMVLGMGNESAAYVFGLWDGLRIIRDTEGGDDLLAYDPSFLLPANDVARFVCEVEAGELRFTIRNLDGSMRTYLAADDPDPLPPDNVFFGGEIDGTIGEYLHFDDFTLEECTQR